MSHYLNELRELISAQQKEYTESDPEFIVGEQLCDIAERDPASAEILYTDLQHPAMSIIKAAAKLKIYADKNHGNSSCFCITPKVAENILRKFYGLAVKDDTAVKGEKPDEGYIDLSAFLD